MKLKKGDTVQIKGTKEIFPILARAGQFLLLGHNYRYKERIYHISKLEAITFQLNKHTNNKIIKTTWRERING